MIIDNRKTTYGSQIYDTYRKEFLLSIFLEDSDLERFVCLEIISLNPFYFEMRKLFEPVWNCL